MGLNTTTDFTDLLTELDNGRALQRISEEIAEVVDAVQEHKKAGEVTIKLKFVPEGKMAVVSVQTTAKKPMEPYRSTIFFHGEAGSLHREDPKQLNLRNLDSPPLKSVDFTGFDDPDKN